MAIMKFEKPFPRAASVIAVTSLVNCCASRNRGTGAHSLVSLLIMIAVPTPQFGWHPQLNDPHCDSFPFTMSANPANVLMNEIGNQSPVGSIFPTCVLTSDAKCDSVYRWRKRRSGVISSSRPGDDTRWQGVKHTCFWLF